jgi:predicted nucleotidyltransferase
MTVGGFSDEKWSEIARTVASVAPTERILVFGSRAKGNFREGSDVDLAVEGWMSRLGIQPVPLSWI